MPLISAKKKKKNWGGVREPMMTILWLLAVVSYPIYEFRIALVQRISYHAWKCAELCINVLEWWGPMITLAPGSGVLPT